MTLFYYNYNLFHTSNPAFMYMNGPTMEVLNQLNRDWLKLQDGPLVTMDAGSNIHLLFREDQSQLYLKLQDQWMQKYNLWTDEGIVQTSGSQA